MGPSPAGHTGWGGREEKRMNLALVRGSLLMPVNRNTHNPPAVHVLWMATLGVFVCWFSFSERTVFGRRGSTQVPRCSLGSGRFWSQRCEGGQETFFSGPCSIGEGPAGDAEVGRPEGEEVMEQGRSAHGGPSPAREPQPQLLLFF